MKTIVYALAGVALAASASCTLAQTSTPGFRPPSVPLIAHDPYFSVWSNANQLNDDATRHWTGREQAVTSIIRCDGKAYRLMGNSPSDVPAMAQINLQVTPLRSIYTFAGAGIQIKLTFTSPLLPDDLDLMSRPVTYVTYDVTSTDGKTHDVSVTLDANAALTVNNPGPDVKANTESMGNLSVARVGTVAQPILEKRGDDLRIDWGYLYLAADKKTVTVTVKKTTATPAPESRKLDTSLVAELKLGKVGAKTVSTHALLAYDDLYGIQFMEQNLRPYWRRNGEDAKALLTKAEANYDAVMKRVVAFDTELMADMTKVGGAKYAQLAALAYREALAAQKLVADANGKPLSFSKENFSNGCIATIDLIYPAGPQQIALSPSLLKASLQPIMMYAASKYWKFPFAPHDLGTYPMANGQVYGDGERGENNQMPIEESGNLMILVTALAKVEGNTRFSDPFWPKLTQWAEYMADKGFDPENQLCTDDFAGHLAHNVNLSAKAIMGLGCYAELARMRGDAATAKKYRNLAEKFAKQWQDAAAKDPVSRLAFDREGTWSQKYNLAWDSILGLNLFPQSVYDREMAFYRTKINQYGLPLDNRRTYTKLDWEVWTATLTGRRDDFEAIINPMYDWMNATSSRVPMTDWYDTKDGKQQGFQARTAVGGVFIPLLKDKAIWTKWAGRDKAAASLSGWAPMPLRTITEEVVPTGQTTAGLKWQYSLDKPGADWFAVNFNDASWKSGEAGFGTRDTPAIKVRTEWNTGDIWLRRTFDFDGNVSEPLFIYGFHDEDVEVYLNGKLVGSRQGFRADYGRLFAIPAGLLKQGKNTFAIHCHQTTGGQGIDIGIGRIVKETK